MSQAIVETVKADLVARGFDLSGPCGAFAIVKRVAWILRSTGAGLLSKPSGNNCEGYATDIVCYPDGRIRDILGDGGGANTPQWPEDDLEVVDASRYRLAVFPGDEPQPIPTPTPDPVPVPAPVDLAPLLAEIAALKQRVQTLEDKPETPTYVLPNLYVEGTTGRAWGHGHSVKLKVVAE